VGVGAGERDKGERIKDKQGKPNYRFELCDLALRFFGDYFAVLPALILFHYG